MNHKIAILFPGIGYHEDKPLLYYAKDLVACMGYEYRTVKYGEMPKNIKEDATKQEEALILAGQEIQKQLDEIDFSKYESIVFISKSIGSVLAVDYANSHNLDVKHILFTPIQETLKYLIKRGIVFHGTNDDWINTEDLKKKCMEEGLSLYLTENANHSLETENTLNNIAILKVVIGQIEDFLDTEYVSVEKHYDMLIDEGNDPVYDSLPLKEYMDKSDGQYFIQCLSLTPTKNVLEIGVGTGRLAIRVAEYCKTFCGIDISAKTVKRAKQNLKKYDNVSILQGDFLEYTFDTTYDVIYSSQVFWHIKDKQKAIIKIAKLLTENGIFVLSIDKEQSEITDYVSRKVMMFPDDKDKILE
ncbi:class I SAM-dependent methyltransferase [Anaeromicropila herbilytica]|uniref:Methyltransferase domain-containing protein n=1 Tax=Anaeromicropila herbilytica TaxID=2785025 RepID=A0A7R7ELN6_9FIRM|nr:class I SAM-dependent methyltransferase [Anaeromicropila herbilytica]BCN30901.1 hypothetical protein bsdtb5_21960 [Anaeromicropila herbilytica]